MGARAWAAGRRRDQYRPPRAELWLAGHYLRRGIWRRPHRRRNHRKGGHGAAALLLRPFDRAQRHGVLYGDAFPEWRGNIFLGALAFRHLSRLVIEGEKIIREERLLEDREWIVRMVEQGPDGMLYIGVDAGMILRLAPAD